MQSTVGQILEGTFVLVLVFLIVTNAKGFDEVVKQIGDTYIGAVKQLQGGGPPTGA